MPTPEETAAAEAAAAQAAADEAAATAAAEAKAKEEGESLGEGGKAALKAERARAAKAEKELKRLQDEAAAREAEAMSESEKAIKAARDEGAKEATTAADKRIIRAEVKALAAKKLNDPADAVAMLDLEQFSVDENGEVDAGAISSALDALVTQKPYLAAKPAGVGDGDGGPRTPPPGAGTLAEQIKEAEAKQDWPEARRLKSIMLAPKQ